MILTIFTLLFLFQIKHFLADYVFQNEYMLGKFKEEGWQKPLAAHCSVHGLLTWLICILYTSNPWIAACLCLLDFALHFIMDRIKASPSFLGKYNPQQKEFWWTLGADQMWHHMTHYAIIALLVL